MAALTSSGGEYTAAEKRSSRSYVAELAAATALYLVLLSASLRTVEHASGAVKYGIAILPAFGAAAMAVAMIRFALRLDELQRRTFVNAAAIAALFTAVVTLGLGFLENAGVPRISMVWVWPIAVGSWGIVLPFCRRPYQ